MRGATIPVRLPIDHDAIRSKHGGRCFICGLVAGDQDFIHDIIFEDDLTVAFLSKYPTVAGYALVAPRKHLEQVTGDFSMTEYLALQGTIYQVGEAVRKATPTERLYVLSLGSQQANRHVHWHIVPLPPGTPFQEQQFSLLNRNDYLRFAREETGDLLVRIKAQLRG